MAVDIWICGSDTCKWLHFTHFVMHYILWYDLSEGKPQILVFILIKLNSHYLIGLITQCFYNCRSVEKRCQKYDLRPYVLFDIQEGQELATPLG